MRKPKWIVALALVVATTCGLFATRAGGQEPEKLRVIVFGAHPDDCEIRCGGLAKICSERGDLVKFVSATNGDIGHWGMAGGVRANRRNTEGQAAADVLGITTEVLDIHDGELMPTLENRRTFIKLIRQWEADIVIGHRPNDYHPDHRYTGVLMQDSAYMVSVPFICPDVPPIQKNPIFLYSYDRFQKPNPFQADIVVPIDRVIDKKVEALALIESQFVEGGANGSADQSPKTEEERQAKREEVKESFKRRFASVANDCREKLVELYGEAGKSVKYAEAFEICEYGRRPSKEEILKLFPIE